MAISGQLWYGAEGYEAGSSPAPYDSTHGDFRIGYIDSDKSGSGVETYNSTSGSYSEYYAVGLDTADNLYFGLTMDTNDATYMVVGNIASGAVLGRIQVGASGSEAPSGIYDLVNDLSVDYVNHKVYFGVWGSDATSTGIFEVTYNANAASTGTATLTSGYNGATGTANANSDYLLTESNSHDSGYLNGMGFWLNTATSQLYYIDDSFDGASYSNGAINNGIYVVSTASQNAAPTLLASLPSGNGSDTDDIQSIVSMVVDTAKGLIYFTTDETNLTGSGSESPPDTSKDGLYYVSINGGTPVRMTLPSGVYLDYPQGGESGAASYNGLALDPNTQTLYVSDLGNAFVGGTRGANILQLTLNAGGTGFNSGTNNYYVVDANDPDAVADGLVFAALPTLTTTATSSQAVQGSTSYLASASAVTLTDPDSNIQSATVKIANGSGNAVSGDELYVTQAGVNAQSGTITIDGATFTVAFNTTTNTMTLTGVATPVQYAAALADVTYRDTGNDTTTVGHAVRTLTWTTSDGEAGSPTNGAYNLKTTTLTLDRAPNTTTHTANAVQGASTGAQLLSDTDPDLDGLTVTAVTGGTVGSAKAGNYGSLTLNSNDTYSYTANGTITAPTGSHPTDSFTYTVADGHGGVANETLNIVLDRLPTVTTETASVQSSGTVTGASGTSAGSGALAGDSDPDADVLTVSALGGSSAALGTSVAGTYGHLTLNANGSYSYVADNGAAIVEAANGSPITDSFSYSVSDGHGGVTAATLAFTITLGANATESITNLTGSQTLSLGSSTLTITESAPTIYSGVIQDGSSGNAGGRVFLDGPDELTLTSAQTYTGQTVLDQDTTLALAGSASIADSVRLILKTTGTTFDISGLTDGGASISRLTGVTGSTIDVGSNTLTVVESTSTAFAGVIHDGPNGSGGGLDVDGPGTLTLSGVEGYTGATVLDDHAILALTGSGSIAASLGLALPTVGTTLDISGLTDGGTSVHDLTGVSGSTIDLGANALTIVETASTTYAGFIQDGPNGIGGALNVDGPGILTLTGVEGYTGATVLASDATLALVGAGSIVDSVSLTLSTSGTTLDISGAGGPRQVGSLSGGTGSTIDLGSGSLVVKESASTTFGGLIQDGPNGSGGTLVLNGTGTLTLSGANSFTGGATLQAGTLQLAAVGAAGSAAISFISAATLELDNGALGGGGDAFSFANTVVGLATSGAAIDLAGLSYVAGQTSAIVENNQLTVTAGAVSVVIPVSGLANGTTFTTAQDGGGAGTLVNDEQAPVMQFAVMQTAVHTNTLTTVQAAPAASTPFYQASGNNQTVRSSVGSHVDLLGHGDTFVLLAHSGQEVLQGYQPGLDALQFSTSMFSNATALLAHATSDGKGDTLITVDAHDSLLLLGVTPAQLQAHYHDLHFV